MSLCFFVSDLHGALPRYRQLLAAIAQERPAAVFLGGDLLPHWAAEGGAAYRDFIADVLVEGLVALRHSMREAYPRVFSIMGNDDLRVHEPRFVELESRGLWQYAHARRLVYGQFTVYGYAFVPPTPFSLKDWERYDVSAYVDPGCIPPEEGRHSLPVDTERLRFLTIAQDLVTLVGEDSMRSAILLCHSPPYRTNLDRAALDHVTYEHVPADVHVGSIALRRFIEDRQPCLTLHGHVHESARLTGSWRDRIGRTHLLSAAHDGPELALVRFDPEAPEEATRELL